MKILFVLTSHNALGNTGYKTGFWLDEFTAPYYALKDTSAVIVIASPKGGQPPIDPKSAEPDNQTETTKRFDADNGLQQELAHTKKLSEVTADDFDAVFYPGGHGPMWDLTNDTDSIRLIESFWKSKKPVAALCHGPSVLLHAKDEKGNSLVKNKRITGFSNTEEAGARLTNVVPFLLEDELKKFGAIYSKKENWASYAIKDGLLITGQNPSSSNEVVKQLLYLLQPKLV